MPDSSDGGAPDRALTGLRVLEIADEKGEYAGKLLADLGADVIKIEPPGGGSSRHIPPFLKDIPGPHRSLHFAYHNTSKRAITLSLTESDGRDVFRALVRTADVVLESYPPGYLESLELGYDQLSLLNPGVILTRISPFGQEGPYRDFRATDLTMLALSGPMFTTGLSNRPPLAYGAQLTFNVGGMHGAAGTLLAVADRRRSGRGQVVDISIQEVVCQWAPSAVQSYEMRREVPVRGGREPGYTMRVYPCKDGYVNGGPRFRWNEFLGWLEEEDLVGDFREERWQDENYRVAHQDEIMARIEQLFSRYTKQEIYHKAQTMRMLITPMNSIAEAVASPQLKARDWFVEVEHPEWSSSIRYPGAPFKLSETPWRTQRAPLIGEHNLQIYNEELGIPLPQLAALTSAGII